MINTSLSTLGRVINALAKGAGKLAPPYRESVLTWLLKENLGGNAKTAVLVNVSPSAWNLGETRSSLQFALRAMKVVNKARVNEVCFVHVCHVPRGDKPPYCVRSPPLPPIGGG